MGTGMGVVVGSGAAEGGDVEATISPHSSPVFPQALAQAREDKFGIEIFEVVVLDTDVHRFVLQSKV